MDWRKNEIKFRDMGGEHLAVYAGQCVVCNSRVFFAQDIVNGAPGAPYSPDFRGMIDERHAAFELVASEYDCIGEPVIICAHCENTRQSYERALKIARAKWEAK